MLLALLLQAPVVFESPRVEIHADFERPDLMKSLGTAVERLVPYFEREARVSFPEHERLVFHVLRDVDAFNEWSDRTFASQPGGEPKSLRLHVRRHARQRRARSTTSRGRVSPRGRRAGEAQSRSILAFLSDDASGRWHEAYTQFLAELRARAHPRPHSDLDTEFGRVDDRWRASLGDLDAFQRSWTEVDRHLVGDWRELWWSSQWVDGHLVTAANHWSTFSMVLHNAPIDRKRFDVSTELRILDVGEGRAEIALFRKEQPVEFVSLSMTRNGQVWVAGLRDGRWTTFGANREPASLDGPDWSTVKIQADGSELRILLDGKQVLEARIDDSFDVGRGYWGLGSYQSAVLYRNARLQGS